MANKQNTAVNITTKIDSLKLIDFRVEPLDPLEQLTLDSTLFGYENKVNMRIEPALKSLHIQYTLDIFTDEKKHRKLGEISATGEFELINIEAFKNKEELQLPLELMAMYIGIMIATVRGMLVVKAQGTHLEGAYVPILNPMDFFKKPQ